MRLTREQHTRQTFGFDGSTWNPRWDYSRKFRLSCTTWRHVFTAENRRNMKQVLGESWLGYYVRGGMIDEAKRILKLKG